MKLSLFDKSANKLLNVHIEQMTPSQIAIDVGRHGQVLEINVVNGVVSVLVWDNQESDEPKTIPLQPIPRLKQYPRLPFREGHRMD